MCINQKHEQVILNQKWQIQYIQDEQQIRMQQGFEYREQHIYIPLKKLQPLKKQIQDAKIFRQNYFEDSEQHIEMIVVRSPYNKILTLSLVAHQFYSAIKYINSNSKDFLRIISVNLQQKSTNQNKFFVQSLIRQQGIISLQDIIFLIAQQSTQDQHFGLVQLAYVMLERIEILIQKHLNFLKKLDPYSLKFYICKHSLQQDEYQILIGLETIKFSIFDKTKQYQGYTKTMQTQLKQANRFKMPQKQQTNLKLPLKAQQFIKKEMQQRLNNQITKSSTQYSMLFLDHFVKYAVDVFLCCKSSFIGLVKVLKEKKIIYSTTLSQQTKIHLPQCPSGHSV